jgi:hypothetical protein
VIDSFELLSGTWFHPHRVDWWRDQRHMKSTRTKMKWVIEWNIFIRLCSTIHKDIHLSNERNIIGIGPSIKSAAKRSKIHPLQQAPNDLSRLTNDLIPHGGSKVSYFRATEPVDWKNGCRWQLTAPLSRHRCVAMTLSRRDTHARDTHELCVVCELCMFTLKDA